MLALVSAAGFALWANTDIGSAEKPIEFSIKPGSGLISATQQIAEAGVPVQPTLLALLARIVGQSQRLKAGNYALKPGTTPRMLISQLARGEFAQESLVIIEGWTFKQMRRAIADHPALKHDTAAMTEQELLAKSRGCLEFGLGASHATAEHLAQTIFNLEQTDDAAAALVVAFPTAA